jgi:hypothetical protein
LGKAIEVGAAGNSIWSGAGYIDMTRNVAYTSGAYRYSANGTAARFEIDTSVFAWYTAPSWDGTGSNIISFTQALTLNSNGNLALQGGTTSASGVGVTFPASQSASTDANCLDDYEEGTFTPVISGTTTSGTGTYSVQNGAYVKIGNLVQYQIYIILTAHTGTGNITITGLPFTASANHYPPAAVYVDNLALTANNYPQIAVSTSSSTFLVRQVPVGGGPAAAVPMDTQFDILLSGTYQV